MPFKRSRYRIKYPELYVTKPTKYQVTVLKIKMAVITLLLSALILIVSFKLELSSDSWQWTLALFMPSIDLAILILLFSDSSIEKEGSISKFLYDFLISNESKKVIKENHKLHAIRRPTALVNKHLKSYANWDNF